MGRCESSIWEPPLRCAIRLSQQLARNIGLGRGIVLRDHCLILLHSLITPAQQIVHLTCGKLSPLLQIQLPVWDTHREFVLLKRSFVVLLTAKTLSQTKRREFRVQSGVLSRLGSGKELLSVFVPTTPNPTSGFYLLVEKSLVRELDMPVQQAFKLVITMGIAKEPELVTTTAKLQRKDLTAKA